MGNIEKAKHKLSNKRPNEDPLNNTASPHPEKCQILDRWGSGRSTITQDALNKAILRFIIEDIQPLCIVDSPAFVNLIRIGLPPNIRIMCRKTLREKIHETYLKMKTALEKKLSEIELVATTADLWSKAKKLIRLFYAFFSLICNFFIFNKFKFKFIGVTWE